MPIFKCENLSLEKTLIDLYNLVVEHGGFVSDNVTVLEKQGDLSILSSLPKDNQDELIVIPAACLPRIEEFLITAHDNKIVAVPKYPGVSESHVATMDLILEIYNITKKLEKHREVCPWLALEMKPELMQKLFEARAEAPKLKKYYEMYNCKNIDELLIWTFLGSRVLSFKASNEEDSSLCLMPFIDFVNHRLESPVYHSSADNLDTTSVRNFTPVNDSNESYAHYGILDPIDSFLVYGFIDFSVPFVRSVPLQFKLNEYSHIQVDTRISQLYTADLPDTVKDLRTYMPYVLGLDESVLQLSHLLIPGETAPRALRRVLEYFIRTWKPGLSLSVIKDIVINAEQVIIDTNIGYYASLSSDLVTYCDSNVPASLIQSLNNLVELQMNKLHQYQDRMSKMI